MRRWRYREREADWPQRLKNSMCNKLLVNGRVRALTPATWLKRDQPIITALSQHLAYGNSSQNRNSLSLPVVRVWESWWPELQWGRIDLQICFSSSSFCLLLDLTRISEKRRKGEGEACLWLMCGWRVGTVCISVPLCFQTNITAHP